jgi:hypothetical protein
MNEEWRSLVRSGQSLVTSLGDAKWALGDLVLTVEVKYGEQNLQKFAVEIGVEDKTLPPIPGRNQGVADKCDTCRKLVNASDSLSFRRVKHLLKEGMTAADAERAVDEWAITTGTKQVEK